NGRVEHAAHDSRRGVFDSQSTLFARYAARITLRDKLLGGVPKDPQLIEGWLRSRAGLTDPDEIRHMMLRTLAELGVETRDDMSFEQLEQASAAVAARKQTTGFKVGERGLYVEARQIKAMLKESTNVVFGGERFGPTRQAVRRRARVRRAGSGLARCARATRRGDDHRPHLRSGWPTQHCRLPRVRAGRDARLPGADHARLPVGGAVGRPVGARAGERAR